MLDQKCSFCGGKNLVISYEKIIYDFVEGIPVKIEIPKYDCPNCKEIYYRLGD